MDRLFWCFFLLDGNFFFDKMKTRTDRPKESDTKIYGVKCVTEKKLPQNARLMVQAAHVNFPTEEKNKLTPKPEQEAIRSA